MKKIFFVFVILMSIMLLGGQPLDVRKLSEKDFTPELIEAIRQNNNQVRTHLSFNYDPTDIPRVLPASGDPAFLQGTLPWIKDFAGDINGYTAGDSLHFWWSNSERFLIQQVAGNPTQLSFTTVNPLWWGEETVAITISDQPITPGMPGVTWLFTIRVTNVLDAPVFNFPNVAQPIPNGFIFSTPEDTPLTVNFIGNMPGTTTPYIVSVDNMGSPSSIQLFVTPTSSVVGYTQADSGAGLGTAVTFTPPANVVGAYEDYTFQLTAKDRTYNTIASRTITLRVTQVNDPPEILSVKADGIEIFAPLSEIDPIDQGVSVNFEVQANDIDGDTLYYSWTLDGVEISTSDNFDHVFNVPGYFPLNLRVYDRSDNSGFELNQSWNITVSPLGPQFEPWEDMGPFTEDIYVTITAPGIEVEGIYFSLVGPTGPWTQYQNPVLIPIQTNPPAAYSQTVWAYFVPFEGPDSSVNHQTYNMTGTVQTPVFSHASGRYLPNNPDDSIGSNFLLTLSTQPADADIVYSTDGGVEWLPYSEPGIAIPSQSVRNFVAKAIRTDWIESPVSAAHNYIINDQVVFAEPGLATIPAPDIDGNYCVCFGDSVKVEFSGFVATPGAATIYYSLEPLGLPAQAQVYTWSSASGDPLTLYLHSSTTIRWWAEYNDPTADPGAEEWYPSETYSFDFQINNRTRMLFWDDLTNPTVFDPIPKSLPADYYDAPIYISINTDVAPDLDPPADIYYQYKTDDMGAFSPWTLYSGPIYAERDITIRTYATALPPFTTLESLVHEGVYTITGQLPVPLVAHTSPPASAYTTPWASIGGEHTYEENVTISLQMPAGDRWQDADIYYSLDGGESFNLYVAPFDLTMSHYRLQAYAAKANWINSEYSAIADYFVKFLPPVTFTTNDGPLQIPDLDVALSQHYQQIEVSLFTYDAAEIRYTLDGSEPTGTSALYTVPITLGSNPLEAAELYTLKAISLKPGWVDSDPITWTFQFIPTMVDPVFEPVATEHPLPIMVSIVADLNLAPYQIYYMEDPTGTAVPDSVNGILYNGQFEVASSRGFAARAYKDGYRPSQVVYKAYNIANTIGDIVFNPEGGTYTSPTSVSLSVVPAEATISYSFDNVNWQPYTGLLDLALGTQTTIYAKAEMAGSETKYGDDTYTVLQVPEILPLQTEYASGDEIEINISTPVGNLYYSINGAAPVLGISPVILPEIGTDTTVEAWAENDGVETVHLVRNYVFNSALALPVANVVSGTYFEPFTVVLSHAHNAAIHYSLDGINYIPYTGEEIDILHNQNLYAYASRDLYPNSGTRVWNYLLKVRNPQASLASGEYAGPREVVFSVNTPDAEIYYNTSSADLPFEEWTLYDDAPISLTTSTNYWVVGSKDDWLSSDIRNFSYTINGMVAPVTFTPAAGTYFDVQTVTLGSSTPGAQIYYSIDGTEPNQSYESAISVDESTLIRAYATRANWLPAAESSANYVLKVSQITDGGIPAIHYETFTVTLSTITSNTGIYYTLDGSIPSQSNGTLYSAPVEITESSILKAIAIRDGWADSDIYERGFVINQRVAAPVFDPAQELHTNSPVLVTITSDTPDASILYRTSMSGAWLPYTEALSITETTLIQAKAIKTDWVDSEITTKQYIIDIPVTPQVATPAFSPAPGTYNLPQNVSISSTDGATIYYTTDGSDPTDESLVYGAPIAVNVNTTLKAFAQLTGYTDSDIATADYIIAPDQVLDPIVFPAGGTFTEPFTVTVFERTDGSTILYQMDPETETWEIYDPAEPIIISTSTTLRVKATKANMIDSGIVERTYTITGFVASPVFMPGSTTSSAPIDVEITVATEDAEIYYTTDGSDPTEASILYSSAITVPLNSTMFIRARAFRDGWQPSSIVSATYTVTGTVAEVAFSPMGGTYPNAQLVVLSSPTLGASIRYTTDDSDPSETEGILYTAPIPVNTSQTIKAIAYRENWETSGITTQTYVITGSIAMGVADMPSGTYNNGITVSFADPVPALATIYYTLDGTEPTISSMPYTAPIDIDAVDNQEVILKAKAFLDGWIESPTSTYSYLFRAADVNFDPAGGTYTEVQYVTLSSATEDAEIYYTLDGSAPNEGSTPYTGPITVASNSVIRARAYKGVYMASQINSATYAIDLSQYVVANPIFSPASTSSYTPLSITIDTDTEDATIRYTLNGMDPSPSYGTVYSSAITVPSNTTMFIKAIAYKDGWTPSAVVAAYYSVTGTVADVTFTPAGGIYTSTMEVELNSVTEGATIRYTTDGSDPTALSNVYNRPITLNSGTTTIKAAAFRSGWQQSGVTQETYTITGTVAFAQPIFSPAGGTYGNSQSVSIAAPIPASAQVYYTLDGSIPDPLNPNTFLYAPGDMINITGDTTINAIAVLAGWNTSEMMSASYTFQANAPIFSVPGGWYESPQIVALSSSTTGASIRYTLDGTNPSITNGLDYTGPINVGVNRTIKAYAYKAGYQNSAVISHTYAIGDYVPVVATPEFSIPSGIYQSAQSVTITVGTPGATIRYTTDGSDPSETLGTIYTAPVAISSSAILKAIAFRSDWQTSQIAVASYMITGTVAAVQFSPNPGTYTTPQTVVLTSTTEGAYFYYTTDGSEPSPINGTLYTTGIYIPQNSTVNLRARAFKENWTPSAIGNASYTVTGQVFVSDPVFSLAPGTYATMQTLSLGNPDPADAEIRYTTDGSDPSLPTSTYLVYNPASPIALELGALRTIKVSAHKANWTPSPVYTAVYNMTGTVTLPSNMFSPVAGTYQTPQNITLDTNTYPAGALLRYTLNGGEPSEISPAYNPQTGIAINGSATLKVKGFMPGWEPSLTSEAMYNITGSVVIGSPVFTPPAGSYTTPQSVVIGNPIPAGAVIRYTTDGSEPHAGSPLYTAAIQLASNTLTTIKAKAFMDGWSDSITYEATYNITGQITMTTPVFDPLPGVYTAPVSVTINTATVPAGAQIYYTLDGSDPNTGSLLYSGTPIQINANEALTIRTRAYYQDWLPSAIYTGNYSVTGTAGIVGTVFTPDPGLYNTAQTVIISTNTYPLGAVVRYTTDGSEPGADSPIYAPNTPIQLGLNTITEIKAKVFAPGWISSPTYTGVYTITGTVSVAGINLTPAPGIYQTLQNVFFSGVPVPNDAVIRYTTNGADPVATDPVFSAALNPPLNSTLNLKLRAFKDGWIASEVISGTYIFTGQVQIPTAMFTPAAGTYQTAQTITLNTATVPATATLRYTLNNTVPTEESPAYTGPIVLPLGSGVSNIRVRAFLENWLPSTEASATYNITGQVAFNTPVFTPAAGTFANAIQVQINSTNPADAVIRYTTDGSEPTASSPVLSGSINLTTLNSTHTVKVKAFKTDWIASATQTAVYVLTGQAAIATPSFSPAPGIFTEAQSVSINTSVTPTNATIRYTIDGSDPTATSPVYSAPIQIGLNSDITIRARAFAANWTPSEVYVGRFQVTGQVAFNATPIFSPDAGTYTSAQVLTISQPSPAGAVIRYTLDGSDPTQDSPEYTAGINLPLDSTTTVKIKAWAENWIPSSVHQAVYTITGQVALNGTLFNPEPGLYTEAQDVTVTAGVYPTSATIHYTLDGSEPTAESDVYTSGMVLNVPLNTMDYTLKIKAFADNWIDSPTYTAVYSVTGTVQLVSNPFMPNPGTYTTAQQITIAAPELPTDALIRYTTDGSDPSPESPAYTVPIMIPTNSENFVLKIRGYRENWIPSEVITALYTVTGTLTEPVFSHPSAIYASAMEVSITSNPDVQGVMIYYTTDGSEPTTASNLYSEPIEVPALAQNFTIKAKAFKQDWIASGTSEAVYSVLLLPLNVRTVTYEGYVRVLWSNPNARGLDGFNVYRKASNEGSFSKLNDELVPVSQVIGSDHYYDDYEISNNMSYQYYVTAVYDGMESNESGVTSAEYQSAELDITENTRAYPNPAETGTTFQIKLSRNDNVQITVSIFDFAGKKVRTLTGSNLNTNLVEIPWNLQNDSGKKVGRGTYFARIQATDSAKRTEKVIKISVK